MENLKDQGKRKEFVMPEMYLEEITAEVITDISADAPDQPIGDLDYDPNCEW